MSLSEMGKHKGRGNLEILKRAGFVKRFYFGQVKSEIPVKHLSGDI